MSLPDITADEFIAWLISYFPVNWFGDSAQVPGGGLYAKVSAIKTGDALLYSKILSYYTSLTLTNAVGTQVDDIAKDYFGGKLPRQTGETDAAYKARIVSRLVLPIGTREGMQQGIFYAIGTQPVIRENRDLRNSCGWAKWTPGQPQLAQVYGNFAWNEAGSTYYDIGAYQAFIDVQQPEPSSASFLTFDQIMALVNSLKPEATIMWVRVIGPASTSGVPIH